MSDQNPYEQLDVAEDASFEVIQTARDRLVERYQDDEHSREAVVAAYDAILMDRLRKRQEGKVKVPEGIRTADRVEAKPPKFSLPQLEQSSPSWLQRSLDQPTTQEIAIVGGVFAVLAGINFTVTTAEMSSEDILNVSALLLALGVGFTLYWLNRKEQRLGRAVLLTLAALFVGGALAAFLLNLGLSIGTSPQVIVTFVVVLCFWLVSSFLR